MKILFDKVVASPKPFSCREGEVTMEGTLRKSGYGRIAFEAQLRGDIELGCDRCGQAYCHSVDEALRFSLSNAVIKDKEDLDIIEFLDGVIDVTYILQGEIETKKSTYHYCPKCEASDEDFEIEF